MIFHENQLEFLGKRNHSIVYTSSSICINYGQTDYFQSSLEPHLWTLFDYFELWFLATLEVTTVSYYTAVWALELGELYLKWLWVDQIHSTLRERYGTVIITVAVNQEALNYSLHGRSSTCSHPCKVSREHRSWESNNYCIGDDGKWGQKKFGKVQHNTV